MPIYTHKCAKCGATLTKLRRLSDPVPLCPVYPFSHGQMLKQLDAPAFRVGGVGAYSPGMK